jgi:hypothetical protein
MRSSERIVCRLQAHADVKHVSYQRNSRGPNAAPAKVHSAIVPPYQTATNGSDSTVQRIRHRAYSAGNETGNSPGTNQVGRRSPSHCKNGGRERHDGDDRNREEAFKPFVAEDHPVPVRAWLANEADGTE